MLVICATAFTSSVVLAASGSKTGVRLCERELERASALYDVPLGILYSVGLTETGRRGSLHPFALNIEGDSHFAPNASDAVREIRRAQARGKKLIDVGCMQINIHYHGEKFASVREMLVPRENVTYAARFLSELKRREGTWTMAVARYHAGPNNNPAQKRYICRVIANMVASGFGKWTSNARQFCK
ncbi:MULTISPECIES: transglycosylase SLT domain-containing protein [Pseudovibrio]|uniref:transglycosylase SLT domain-containing protein n=1 Tax=Stappiaceae TaxID=2821832 RepID=UPI0023671AA4|nr:MULTISPECIES: transglycosylase SLT domain-containing protein [Pseudovibrio]MDD7909004.1 transglycosylase SLT domain-containing protein [Pseudovibrio exalbescens]MDX5593675.1 transglycosylase SLT domain-containing protein [Pseudovibrio sp. SPO723]